jgi:hypothetical protein
MCAAQWGTGDRTASGAFLAISSACGGKSRDQQGRDVTQEKEIPCDQTLQNEHRLG